MKKLITIIAFTFLLLACDMFQVDVIEYLDYYTNTAGIEELTYDGNYPVDSRGIINIPSGADRVLTFTLRNPQNYTLIPTIEWPTSLVGSGGATPDFNDYTISQINSDTIQLLLTDDFVNALDKADEDTFSAKIQIQDNASKRFFDPHTFEVAINTAPVPVENARLLVEANKWVVAFKVPTFDEFHRDIGILRINNVQTVLEIEDTGNIDKNELESSFLTAAPSGLESLDGSALPSDANTIYYETGIQINNAVQYSISLQDDKGLTTTVSLGNGAEKMRNTFYVNKDAGEGGTGKDKENAFNTIEKALTAIGNMPNPDTQYIINIKGNFTPTGSNSSAINIESATPYNLLLQGWSSGAETGTITAPANSRVLNISGAGANVTLGANLTLTGGDTDFGGGVYVSGGAHFSMTGGVIGGDSEGSNVSEYCGGAVYVNNNATFTLLDGEIKGNTSNAIAGVASGGGGVYVQSGYFFMEGGTINNNKVTSDYTLGGGGVYANTGTTFTMSGGTIKANSATNGSGIYLNGSTMTMSGGEVINNQALGVNGGGIYVKTDARLSIRGDIKIIGNTQGVNASNIVMENNANVEVAGPLTSTISSIGVTPSLARGGTLVVSGNGYINDVNKDAIVCDTISSIVLFKNNIVIGVDEVFIGGSGTGDGLTAESKMKVASQEEFERIKEKFTSGRGIIWILDTITVTSGIHTFDGDNNAIIIKRYDTNSRALISVTGGELSLKNITVDGQGNVNSLGGGTEATDALIRVNTGATLKLNSGTILQNNKNTYTETAGSKAQSGGAINISGGTVELPVNTNAQIKSNQAQHGSAICIVSGTLTMNGGMIGGESANEKNIATSNAAVYVDAGGSFTMSSGDIKNNETQTNTGGGVYVYTGGSFEMSGDAKISNNEALGASQGKGGGVSVRGGSFEMTGGEISGNHAAVHGGAVNIDEGSFEMSGGTISSNTSTKNVGGVYVNNGSFTMISGSITNNMTSDANGGGVYVEDGVTLNLYGNPKITNNKANAINTNGSWSGGTLNNVYFSNTKDSSTIKISAQLTGDANIGLTPHNALEGAVMAQGNGYKISDSDRLKFRLDKNNGGLVLQGDGVDNKIVIPPTSFYVAETNASDEYAGTQSNPFKSVQKAVDTIQDITGGIDDSTQYTIYVRGTITTEGTTQESISTQDGNMGMVEIVGNSELNIKIQGQSNDQKGIIGAGLNGVGKRVLHVGNTKAKVTLGENLTLTGAAIWHGSGEYDTDAGGGVYVKSGTLSVNGTIIENCSATFGGGIFNRGGNVTISHSIIRNNSARRGGGLSNYSGTMSIVDTEITGNYVGGNSESRAHGSGITSYDNGGTVSVDSTVTITGNKTINENALWPIEGYIQDSGATIENSILQ